MIRHIVTALLGLVLGVGIAIGTGNTIDDWTIDDWTIPVEELPVLPPSSRGSDCSSVGPIGSSAYQTCQQQMQTLNEACGMLQGEKHDKCKDAFIDCRVSENKSNELCGCKARGGIILNTNVPFIGRCIEFGNSYQKNSESIRVSP